MTCQALIRLSISLAALGMLTGCETAPLLDHREVSARVKAGLEANSRGLTTREANGGDIKIQATIVADGPVSLPMSIRDGVPLVPARINGSAQVLVVVDTGSQGCVLEARTALAHRVTVLDHKDASMTLGGTTGDEQAWIGLPDEFAIGSWVLKQFPFFVRTHETRVRLGPWNNHDISVDLIGMNAILRSCRYLTLDFPAKRVVFGIARDFDPPSIETSWKAPLLVQNGLPYVQLETDGQSWIALVDSGFNGLLDMDKATAERLHLLEKVRPTDAYRIGLGAPAKGEATQFGFVSLARLDSLGPRMVNIPTLIVPKRSKIGCTMLHPFRVTFDFTRGLLWLEK
jgi:hypothetical protein